MLIKLIILNNLMFWISLLLLCNSIFNLLNFMISLEVSYLVIICSFCSIANIAIYHNGGVFALYVLGMAAAEAVIGFYFAILLYIKRQTTTLNNYNQNKG